MLNVGTETTHIIQEQGEMYCISVGGKTPGTDIHITCYPFLLCNTQVLISNIEDNAISVVSVFVNY